MSNIFFNTLMKLARVQRQPTDRLALQQAVEESAHLDSIQEQITYIEKQLHLPRSLWLQPEEIDQTQMPALAYHAEAGWALLRGQNAMGEWILQSYDPEGNEWIESSPQDKSDYVIVRMTLVRPLDIKSSKVFRVIYNAVMGEKSRLKEIILGGIIINTVALATSLYSMQVYDRVVPTGAEQTLLALTIGVLIAILIELVTKFMRSHLNEKLGDNVDRHLAKTVYSRFLNVRLDQLPSSVGSLAAQLKGYETIRNFLVNVPSQLLVDLPFIVVFTTVLAFIGGYLALIPFSFAIVSIVIGLAFRRKVERLTREATEAI